MKGNRGGTHIPDQGFIDGKSRAGVNDFIPGVAVNLLGKCNGGFAPGKDTNLFCRDLKSPGVIDLPGNGLAKG